MCYKYYFHNDCFTPQNHRFWNSKQAILNFKTIGKINE
ncbi:hypothetical protein HMPREF9296_2387 [Prevotella disiens FB035-09AN]|uniref:Uncharacterized protein n=1 Tax=Prevotella disiens FB035-09AN TaxID=866771 RepID=E1KRI6_9BACT|nr:hypothetical protein HMPREF9296_2387 [Prevotella disiens FB035-09AN]